MKGTYFGTAATTRGTASHILGRPGPGEPSGFLVVPGRAEGVAEGEAEGAGLSQRARRPRPHARSPRATFARADPSPPGTPLLYFRSPRLSLHRCRRVVRRARLRAARQPSQAYRVGRRAHRPFRACLWRHAEGGAEEGRGQNERGTQSACGGARGGLGRGRRERLVRGVAEGLNATSPTQVSQHLPQLSPHFWPPHHLLRPQSRLVTTQQLDPKHGLQHSG